MRQSRLRPRRILFEPLEDRSLLTLVVPQLSSRPGAPATLYLDFDGDTQSQWGGHSNVVTPPYDIDGNKTSFSAAETAAIREIWARVSEDYAPFNVNVTTAVPPRLADRVAAKIDIGGSYSDWYGTLAGGVSYVGGFASAASNVGFVFSQTLSSGNPHYVAEAASHEAGHLFGLEHQSAWSGSQLVSEYNNGNSAWAPIMGNSYYAIRSTWANGPTDESPTSSEDELAIIASLANGFGYAPDDYGNTITTASALPVTSGNVSVSGLIGRNDDRDVFKFSTSGGSVNLTLSPASGGADLDGVLELQNSSGKMLVIANPTGSLGATLATTLVAGTYYLVVHSSGGYGNLGRYSIHGTIAAAATTPATQPTTPSPQPTPQPPPPVVTTTPQPSTTPTVRVIDDGGAAFSSTSSWQVIAGAGYVSDARWTPAGSGAASTWTFSGLAPGVYRVAATWLGSQLNATDAPLSISSGGKPLAGLHVNQQHSPSTFTSGGASWQNLGTFTIQASSLIVRLSSAASGRVVADAIRLERVYSTSGGSTVANSPGIDGMPAPPDSRETVSSIDPTIRSSGIILPDAVDECFQATTQTTKSAGDSAKTRLSSKSDGQQSDELQTAAIDAALTGHGQWAV
jgi:hypothetical protein